MLQKATEEVQTKEEITKNEKVISDLSALNDSSSYVSSDLKEAYGAFSVAASKVKIFQRSFI